MMRPQLAELRARGECLSVLKASEALIYHRFGYGPATFVQRLTVARPRAALARPRSRATPGTATGIPAAGADTGAVEVLRRAECGDILEQVHDRYRRTQPGALSRPHRWWALGAGKPPVSTTPRYVAVHRDAGGVPDGYASYSVADPATMTVDEIIAADDAAATTLVRFVLGHDLMTVIVFRDFPVRTRCAGSWRTCAPPRSATTPTGCGCGCWTSRGR